MREGELTAGGGLETLSRDSHRVTVAAVAALDRGVFDRDLASRALAVPALAESWKQHLRKLVR